jgi:hypothetical protein
VLVIAAAVVVACLAVVFLRGAPTASPPVPTPPIAAPPTPPVASPTPPVVPPSDLREYRLVIDSSVEGSQVYEGTALLGATPLTLVVDNNAVRIRVRQLEVRMQGFEPFVIRAVPSDEPSLRVIANLVPARGVVARPNPVRPPIRVPRPPSNSAPPPPPEDLPNHP